MKSVGHGRTYTAASLLHVAPKVESQQWKGERWLPGAVGGGDGELIFKEEWIKEHVVHIYNGILLSHKEEQYWVICRDMNGPRDCNIE